MTRTLSSTIGAALAAALATLWAVAPAPAQDAAPEGSLRMLNWAHYIDPTILDDFTAETGIEVVYDVYNDSEAVEATLAAGGSGYDLAVVSTEYLGRLAQLGAIEPLKLGQLPGRSRLRADLSAELAALDPGGADEPYAVPYLWGTTGIGYDAAAVAARMPDAPVDSWAMLFDPEVAARFADCGIGMIDAPEQVVSSALAYLGHDPASADPAELEAAFDRVRALIPHVRSFDTSPQEALASGDLCVALVWSGDVLEARENQREGIEVAYSIPREGAVLWFDVLVVPSDAAQAEAAHALVEFLLRPEVIARVTNAVSCPNPNAEAPPFVAPELLADPAIYPPEAVMARLFAVTSRPAAEKAALTRAWRHAKLGL